MSRDFDDNPYAIRIGSLVLHTIGQLLPHQLASGLFNNRDYIYPVGYRATRFYWSTNDCFRRARYICSISENDGSPEFSVTIIEWGVEDVTLTDKSPTVLWRKILDKLELKRKENGFVMKLFPDYFSGEYMFGLAEPHIIRLFESLPGVEMLTNYAFKYGRLQLLDMPLTINPTGCARSEPKLRTHFRKSHNPSSSIRGNNAHASTKTTAAATSVSNFNPTHAAAIFEDMEEDEDFTTCISFSYNKQYIQSKSSQFKKLKCEWRSNVLLAKSKIQVIKPSVRALRRKNKFKQG
jgi:histone-lysine N-methyltransferase MLL3